MRTWSVSGTAFALCTRSSSLSMRTSTSMNPRSLQRKAYFDTYRGRPILIPALPERVSVAFAEESAEEAALLLRLRLRLGARVLRWLWFRRWVRFQGWLRVGFWQRLGVELRLWLWLNVRLGR